MLEASYAESMMAYRAPLCIFPLLISAGCAAPLSAACQDTEQEKLPTPEEVALLEKEVDPNPPEVRSVTLKPSLEDSARILAKTYQFSELIQLLSAEKELSAALTLLRGYAYLEERSGELAEVDLAASAEALPSLKNSIERWRAEAGLYGGRTDISLRYFSRSDSYENKLASLRARFLEGTGKEATKELEKELKNLVSKITRSKSKDLRKDKKQLLEMRLLLLKASDLNSDPSLALKIKRELSIEHADSLEGREAWKGLSLTELKASSKQLQSMREAFVASGDIEAYNHTYPEKSPSKPENEANWSLLRLEEEAMLRYHSRSDLKKSSELFTTLAGRQPANKSRHLLYAGMAAERGGFGELASAAFAKVLALKDAKSIEIALFRQARLMSTFGKFPESIALYQQYRQRFSASDEGARYGLALAFLQNKQAKEAIALIDGLAQSAKDDRTKARYCELVGLASEVGGQHERALRKYQQCAATYRYTFGGWSAEWRFKALKNAHPEIAGIKELSLLKAEVGKAKIPLALKEERQEIQDHFPSDVALLHSIGLDDWAENALSFERKSLHREGRDEGLRECLGFSALDAGQEQYRVAQKAVSSEWFSNPPETMQLWAWHCLYPRPFRTLVEENAASKNLPSELLWSVMRQESAFRPGVESPVGALGLMQLMPSTAIQIAAIDGMDPASIDLKNPRHNIRLGTAYLNLLNEKLMSSLPLIVAAYNAGPHAVALWRGEQEEMATDIFVAGIAYGETRNYVDRVLSNLIRYQMLRDSEDVFRGIPTKIPKIQADLSGLF